MDFKYCVVVFGSLFNILHCVSKDTICITFYLKLHPYSFENTLSDDIAELKSVTLTYQKVNTAILKRLLLRQIRAHYVC